MILLTTSHRPSPRTRSFIKDLASVLPRSQRVNRGHKTIVELAIEARRRNCSFLAIVSEKHGNPGAIHIYEVKDGYPHPSVEVFVGVELGGVKLSRENPESSRAYNAESISVDYTMCLSDDCFYLADALIKVFSKIHSNSASLKLVLEEAEFIVVKWLNVHGNPVGPLLKVKRVVKGGSFESRS
ncbi:MAG: ribosomal biogenesis protein [Desulfurococcaceae archaeon]